MKAVFRKSFERDLKKVKDRVILAKVKQSIEEIEAAISFVVSFTLINRD